MAKPIPEQELNAIEAVVSAHPGGIAIQDIQVELDEVIARRTLQYRLKHLVDEGRLAKEGNRRWAKYLLPAAAKRPGNGTRSIRRGAGRRNSALKAGGQSPGTHTQASPRPKTCRLSARGSLMPTDPTKPPTCQRRNACT